MKEKITKLKLFFSIEKEIAYINEMNRIGWKLVYIKGGCLYTFVKTEPDEYVTIIHGEEIENISSVTSFAAQCGYEVIPHTMDGVGKLIYFTGKKSVVPEDFVSSTEDKLKTERILLKTYNKMLMLYIIICLALLLIDLLYTLIVCDSGFNPILIGSICSMCLISVFTIAITISLKVLTNRIKKKVKVLESELGVFE